MLARFEKFADRIGLSVGVILAVGALIVAGPFPLVPQGLRLGGAIGAAAIILLLTRPLAGQFGNISGSLRASLWAVDIAVLAGFVYTLFNFADVYESMWDGIFILETPQLLVGLFGTLVVIEMVRRIFGPILPVICLLAILYALFGGDMPGILGHTGFSFEETMTAIWFSFSGVFGRVTDLVSTTVLVFLIFGVTLEATGATEILLKMATAATARIRGGAAHSAIVASALFGTISGSPVANVVGTGVFTIPLIKKSGFRSPFAGAVEASASAAGQFTPPIMGAVAFFMAEFTGQSYLTVATVAIIPAFFFFCSLFASVYFEAVRLDIPMQTAESLTPKEWLLSIKFFVPLVTIVVVLLGGASPALAGFWAIVAALVVGLAIDVLYVESRAKILKLPGKLYHALEKGGIQCAQLMMAVGSIGVVIAVVSLTGVAGNFAAMVADAAGGSLFAALVITMMASLVLGMGLPTVPAYIFIILFVGPVIEKLGANVLLIHMFVLYFGVLSNITPPVAIAAYAASPIAGANPMSTAIQAIKISAVGFLIPFILIYNPSIGLMTGFEWGPFIWTMIRVPLVIWLFASSLIGTDKHAINSIERGLRIAVGIGVIYVMPEIQIASFVLGIGIIFVHHKWAKGNAVIPEQFKN